jgi:hypothetical protein
MKALLRKLVAKVIEGNPVGDEPLKGKNVERLAWRKFSRAAVIWEAMRENEKQNAHI